MNPKKVLISDFKAKCIALLHEVNRTGRPTIVTYRGDPIAVVQPIAQARTLGQLAGLADFEGDLVKTDFDGEWEMLQ
jgi:prevent-host-death family protein